MDELVFLKLGGSIITFKDKPDTANIAKIDEIAQEIKQALIAFPQIQLLIGHGSGSFGHSAAKKYDTYNGVKTTQQWQGFAEVGLHAKMLNQIVQQRFDHAGVNLLVFSPFSSIVTRNREIQTWDIRSIQAFLNQGLIPMVYGDVIFDEELGGTILSTEDIFEYLAPRLQPSRILLAGIEEGVWQDYPKRTQLINEIKFSTKSQFAQQVQGSESTDVTGGMKSKVDGMLKLVQTEPGLEIRIFSALKPGNIYKSLPGVPIGTLIHRGEENIK
jgi:isopentenyl phosphate kinase